MLTLRGCRVEMREIEAFLALAEELHFGRAAARLHRTVSSLSQTIKVLERRVGAPLFDRTSRRVALTPLGRRFRDDIAPAYLAAQAALSAAQHDARRSADRQRLTAAATQTVPPQLLDDVTEAFRRAWPAVEVLWHTMPYDQFYAWFGDGGPPGGTDVLFCWLPSVAPEVIPREQVLVGPVVARSPRILLMADDHPLASRAVVDIEELADHEVVYPAARVTPLVDAWVPPTTPGGRPMRRRPVSVLLPEGLAPVIAGGLVHMTAADIYWRAISFPGLVRVPLTGLPAFFLVTTWPAAADSDLVQSFAASAAHRP